jgi:hypothetical protein
MTNLTIRVSEELKSAFIQEAKRQNTTATALFQQWMKEYLNGETPSTNRTNGTDRTAQTSTDNVSADMDETINSLWESIRELKIAIEGNFATMGVNDHVRQLSENQHRFEKRLDNIRDCLDGVSCQISTNGTHSTDTALTNSNDSTDNASADQSETTPTTESVSTNGTDEDSTDNTAQTSTDNVSAEETPQRENSEEEARLLSASQLEKKLGIPQSYISKWNNEKSIPSEDNRYRNAYQEFLNDWERVEKFTKSGKKRIMYRKRSG